MNRDPSGNKILTIGFCLSILPEVTVEVARDTTNFIKLKAAMGLSAVDAWLADYGDY